MHRQPWAAALPTRVHNFGYGFLAIALPFIIRLIPEAIAWPYPLGFDTLGYYIPAMRWWINPFSGQSLPMDILGLFKTAGLFYVLAVGFNRYLMPDPFIAVKLLGPVLIGFVSLSAYFYGRLSLRWDFRKALFASLIATLYFVGLRISWELYRNMLGVVFLFAALTALEVFIGVRRYLLVGAFTLLTFMSHQITSVILLGVLILRSLWLCTRGESGEAKVHFYLSAFAGVLLLYQLYSPQLGRPVIPVAITGFHLSLEASTYVLGFLAYCFIFLLPLALLGLKMDRGIAINSWTLVCLLLLVPVFIGGVASVPLWFRWPLMLVYPLSFYFADGFDKAMRFRCWRSPSGFMVKISAIGLVALIALTSGYYLISYPEHPFPYFSQYNPYLRYIQSSTLQNSISIQDVPSLLRAIDASSSLLGDGAALVVHEAVYVWAVNRLGPEVRLVPVKEPGYLSVKPESTSKAIEQIALMNYYSGYRVYTIWWINGSGWYTMSRLPASFKLIESTGAFGVYLFNPS